MSYAVGGSLAPSGTLNDLDLRLYSADSGTPRASSTSTKDNVERVTSDTSEAAVIVVESKGAFNGASETAALAFGSGFGQRTGPSISLDISSPGTVSPGTTFQVFASVANPGDLRGHLYQVSLTLPAGYSLVTGGLSQSLASLASKAQAMLTWTVRAPDEATASAPFQISGTTTSYGWQWNVSATLSVATATGCSYIVAPPAPIAPEGGTTAVEVSAATGCAWSSASGAGWLRVVGGDTGSGSGQVMVTADPNPSGATRSGTVSVAGLPVSVTQAAAAQAEPLTYYLAEGATGSFFDLSVAIANPNTVDVPALVRFLKEDGSVVQQAHTIAARSRLTIVVDDVEGLASTAVSTVVESTGGLPLVVERTMTWGEDGYGGHGGGAVEAPRTTWYFAEGLKASSTRTCCSPTPARRRPP